MIALLLDVVQLQQVVIDDPFDDVEESPTEQEQTDKGPGRPRCRRAAERRPNEEESGDGEDPGRRVKQTIAQCVRLKSRDGRRRVVIDMANHVMPLQNLVQDDPIEESPEPEAKKDTPGSESLPVDVGVHRSVSSFAQLAPARVLTACWSRPWRPLLWSGPGRGRGRLIDQFLCIAHAKA
jgi:hypothetical protein